MKNIFENNNNLPLDLSTFNFTLMIINLIVIMFALVRMKSNSERRYWVRSGALFLFGSSIFALGVSCMSILEFGGSSIGAASKNGSDAFNISIGTMANIISTLIIIIAIAISIDSKDKKIYVGAFLTSAIFGVTLDLWNVFLPDLIGFIADYNYFTKTLIFIALGMFMFAGVPFYYLTELPKLFGTSFVHSFSKRFNIKPSIGVFTLEGSATLLAIIIGLIAGYRFNNWMIGDVGIGTILNVFIGSFAFGFWTKRFKKTVLKIIGSKNIK